MELDPVSKEADLIVSRASTNQEGVELRDGPSVIGDGRIPSTVIVADPQHPVAQVQQELALWTSRRMKDVRDTITEAALINVTVLVSGETGTGKEIVARAIHYLSGRRDAPFVKVSCAAMARELLESELFGHEPGAFVGAHQLKVGKIEAANGGTLFLDEIGDLDPALQAKLPSLLEDGQFCRVGGRSNIKVDVRIVAATNQDMEAAVATGAFREDLFYRLNVIRIDVPPLRNRLEEIPTLANYFVRHYSRLFQRTGFTLPAETIQRLSQHSFPGNVRELENVIKRMVVLRQPDLTRIPPVAAIAGSDDESRAKPAKTAAGSLKAISREAAQAAEQSAILEALEQTHWNRLLAAKLLNISYRSLLYKIKGAGLDGKRKAPNLT